MAPTIPCSGRKPEATANPIAVGAHEGLAARVAAVAHNFPGPPRRRLREAVIGNRVGDQFLTKKGL